MLGYLKPRGYPILGHSEHVPWLNDSVEALSNTIHQLRAQKRPPYTGAERRRRPRLSSDDYGIRFDRGSVAFDGDKPAGTNAIDPLHPCTAAHAESAVGRERAKLLVGEVAR